MLALRGGQLDLAMQLSPQEGQPFKNNSRFKYYAAADLGAPAGLHADRPGPAPRCTGPPGARARDQPAAAARACDARRRADRQRHPFWRGFVSTDRSIKQRTQNLDLARSLLRAAGAENLKFNLTTWNFLDHGDHAASLQAYAREIGIDIGIEVMDSSRYYDAEPAGADYATHDPVAQPPRDADRVRRARRAERLRHPLLHVDGRLERVALQERRVRRAGPHLPRRGGGRGPAQGDQADGRHSCSATRR